MVADGMGGHLYGDKASHEAINLINRLIEKYLPVVLKKKQHFPLWERILRFFHDDADFTDELDAQMQIVSDILVETNNSIYKLNQDVQLTDGSGMGTTVVGCRFMDKLEKMLVFHVGDSRLYRIRNNRLLQITKDHSVYQLWLDGGQVGKKPGSNIILQGIGPSPEISPEIQIIDIENGDGFLLCSDGLNDMVEDKEIEIIIQDICKANIEEKVQNLIDTANNNGGSDNISVILVCQ